MSDFVITREWMDRFSSMNRGWTRRQLEALQVSWPPIRGWRRRMEGKTITEFQRIEFEQNRKVDVPPRAAVDRAASLEADQAADPADAHA